MIELTQVDFLPLTYESQGESMSETSLQGRRFTEKHQKKGGVIKNRETGSALRAPLL